MQATGLAGGEDEAKWAGAVCEGRKVANEYCSWGAGAGDTPARSRSIEDLTAADFELVPARAAEPSWMVTRFPVSVEEFRVLTEDASQPDPRAMSPTTDPTLTEDDPSEAEEGRLGADDVPEDGQFPPGEGPSGPLIGHSFEATPQTGFSAPDCAIAVGPDDVLVAVNVDLAGYRRDGSLRFRWSGMASLFSAVLPSGAGVFGPRLAYDHYARRWIVTCAARRESPAGSWVMLGASQGSDPIGPYWVWALDFAVDGSDGSDNCADYPMLGFDTQAIYVTTNQFRVGGGFAYAKVRVLDKAQVYSGSALGWWDFWNLKNPDGRPAFTVQPAAHFRGLGGNPPGYFLNALWPGGNTLTLWALQNPLASWRGGVPTLERFSVQCRGYELPPDAEQRGTETRIETNDSRLLNAVFQFAGGVQRLWTAHPTKATWSGDRAARCAVQWYEIDTPTRAVVQQGAFGARGFYYYSPVIQTDVNRNAYLAFGRSSSEEFASLRQTGRRVTDGANSLRSSARVKAGESSYTGGRWGEYFGGCRDPADAGRAWLYGEFADGANAWGTWAFSAAL